MESPDQVVQGPIYILKIKSSKDFKSTELLYALGHKGQANLGLLNLKNIVEDENSRFCLSQKINKGEDTTWEQCLDEAADCKPKAVHVYK